jgi:Grx4 family monothiol glutaredoxin
MTLFISVDAELYPEISESYDVTAVPYFVLLKGRVIAKKISGADPKELADSVTKFSGTSAKYNLPPPQTAVAQPQNAVAGADAMTADGTTDTTDINGAPAEPEEEDINTRLAKLVKAAPVMLFMKGTPAVPQCGFSRQVVALLRKREVRYGFFNILADDEVRQGLKEFSDWPTFPQLYVDGDFIGGLDIIKEEFENDPDFLKNYAAAA